jgi:hypothetical protein
MSKYAMKAKTIALNGILSALAVICLLLATVMPTGRISLYALSSFFIAVSIMESGIKAGWLFYAATSLAGFIIVPEKLALVPYAVFFGFYGIAKYYIEKIGRTIIELIIKYAYFNVCLGAVFLFAREFVADPEVKLPWWILVVALEIVFFLYDFVFTLFINYYKEKLLPKLKL